MFSLILYNRPANIFEVFCFEEIFYVAIIKDFFVIYLGVRLRILSSKKQRLKSKSHILAGFTTQASKFVTEAIHILQREQRANIEKVKGCLV